MKILVLTNKLPYPARDGGSIAALNMLSGLRAAGNDVTCLSLNTSKHNFPVEKIPEEYSRAIRFIGVDCNNSIRPLRMLYNLLFSREPYIAERFNIKRFREKLTGLLNNEQFDLIQLEGPYPGQYIDGIRTCSNAPVSFRAHNVEHRIWKKKATGESNVLKRWYLRNMAVRLERFEMKVVHQTDCLVAISPVDEAFFTSNGYKGPAITIPTGLSLEEYPRTPLPSAPTLFFIGALDWLPNQEGLTWFLDTVFEKLIAEMPELEFHIAGRNAPDRFVKQLRHDRIVYHGEVDDARKFMQTFRVMVVPLLTGSGIRIKILEGMAMGRPVVTTSVGIEGIPAENERDLFVADDPELFKAQVIRLVSEEEANRLVTSARQLIQQNFDTFGLSTRLSRFFKEQVC